MSDDAPERLWVVRRSDDSFEGWDSPEVYATDEGAVEFVRADLFAARDARIRREERERCAKVATAKATRWDALLQKAAPNSLEQAKSLGYVFSAQEIADTLRAMGDE